MAAIGMKLADAIDSKIIEELRRDARTPLATLARKVNLSRNAVRQRIERLERDQVIAGYTIVPGKAFTNGRRVVAVLMITRRDRVRGADVLTAIKRIPEVQACYVVSGEADIVVEVAAPAQERVTEIWAELSQVPGVVDIRTLFVLSSVVGRRNVDTKG